MPLLETVVGRRELPSLNHYVEISTTGMEVICRVVEDRGRFTITREMLFTSKTERNWLTLVEGFYKLATLHYPLRDAEGHRVNTNKSGSV